MIIIHTCNRREWFVYEYIIPQLLQRGITKEEIKVWHDYNRRGNLRSWLLCMEWTRDNLDRRDSAWHLQDDVVISKRFKQVINMEFDGVVCGFCNQSSNRIANNAIGEADSRMMWFSFPCIRIPNEYSGQFVDWIYGSGILKDKQWFRRFQSGKNDDMFFYQFVQDKKKRVFNMKPHLVEHVDWLIGGSVINKERGRDCRALYWEEPELIEQLEDWIKKKNGAVCP